MNIIKQKNIYYPLFIKNKYYVVLEEGEIVKKNYIYKQMYDSECMIPYIDKYMKNKKDFSIEYKNSDIWRDATQKEIDQYENIILVSERKNGHTIRKTKLNGPYNVEDFHNGFKKVNESKRINLVYNKKIVVSTIKPIQLKLRTV